MANLIVVCGPQAVGKMVVAESLRDVFVEMSGSNLAGAIMGRYA